MELLFAAVTFLFISSGIGKKTSSIKSYESVHCLLKFTPQERKIFLKITEERSL